MATLKTLRDKWEKRRRARKRQNRLFLETHKRGHQKSAGDDGRAMRKLKKLVGKAKLRRPLRLKALEHAEALVGVMEKGGNNTGPIVDKIIQANGGMIGEPWCGDFDAFVYRLAGSKAVTRSWASVSLLGLVLGVRKTSSPKPGDIVRYTFDHTGIFVADLGDEIETVEGNTSSSGAVSDSTTGGDGVYRKRRPKYLVNDYLRVTR